MDGKNSFVVIAITSVIIAILVTQGIIRPGYAISKNSSNMTKVADNVTSGSKGANFQAKNSAPYTGGRLLGGCGHSLIPTFSCGLTPSNIHER